MGLELNPHVTETPRDVVPAMRRGLAGRCPECGKGRVFGKFLKVNPTCDACGEALHHHRADDLPPYIVITIVAHIVGTGILLAETWYSWPQWAHMTLWPLLTIVLALWLMQPVKGAVIGLQWANRMHGFGGDAAGTADDGWPPARPVKHNS